MEGSDRGHPRNVDGSVPLRLTICLLNWANGWRDLYDISHVNAMARQLRHYLKMPFQLVLLTDKDTTGSEVEDIRELPDDPEGLTLLSRPNCFRRLRFFDPEYSSQFGTEWVMWIDLDTLIRDDITDLIEPALDDPFGLWLLRGRFVGRKPNERPYNGALCMIRVGQHDHVWKSFHPINSPQEIARTRWVGSDQCWIGLKAPGAPTFGPEHGCYFLGQYCQHRQTHGQDEDFIPARMLNYAGRDKPWSKSTRFQARDIWKEYQRWL